jgi:hypothetical protein
MKARTDQGGHHEGGSWPCKVSCEFHINGRCISELVREDKGKMMATEPEDEKDLK